MTSIRICHQPIYLLPLSDLDQRYVFKKFGENMKAFITVILAILVFLAVSSGVTKIMLMQQDVEFFGHYGFTNPILITYGVIQLLGGILLAFPKTRVVGAFVVAITFLISLVVLVIAGNTPVAIITLVCVTLLGFIVKQSLISKNIKLGANNT